MRIWTKGLMGVTRPIFLGLAAAILLAGAATAAPVPAVAETVIVPLPHPYDETQDASAALQAAREEARRTHRELLVEFGANWCPDCRALAGAMALPDVAPWVAQHFVTVKVDVGRFSKNLDLARQFGLDVKAIPAVAVATPNGMLLNKGQTLVLSDARTMTPTSIVEVLSRWTESKPAS